MPRRPTIEEIEKISQRHACALEASLPGGWCYVLILAQVEEVPSGISVVSNLRPDSIAVAFRQWLDRYEYGESELGPTGQDPE